MSTRRREEICGLQRSPFSCRHLSGWNREYPEGQSNVTQVQGSSFSCILPRNDSCQHPNEKRSAMPRTILDTELEELRKKVIQLGSLVENALAQALSALQANDLVLCSGVIEADAVIVKLRTAIEKKTFRLLTLQQPLG